MSFFEKILHVFQAEMERPTNYSAFHICFLILTVIASFLLIWRFKDTADKTMRRICFAAWVVIVLLEIYKQLVFSMSVSDGVASWNYLWYAFPFQFCSSPIYALPFVFLLKDGPIRRSVITFLSGFSLFAGLAVMLYPNDVFIDMIGVNIQTMIHHGSQVALGFFLAAYNRKNMKLQDLVGGFATFACFAAVAMVLNECVFALVTSKVEGESFNMFYISRHYDCTLPILSEIYKKVPYLMFLIIYLFGFSAVATLFFGIEKGVIALFSRVKKKSAASIVT